MQDDIQYLRATAARAAAGEGELDLQALDMAINRTEKGINVCLCVCVCVLYVRVCHITSIYVFQAVAEHVMHASHSHVTTLPAVIQRGGRKRTQSGERTMQELVSTTTRRSPIKQARYKYPLNYMQAVF